MGQAGAARRRGAGADGIYGAAQGRRIEQGLNKERGKGVFSAAGGLSGKGDNLMRGIMEQAVQVMGWGEYALTRGFPAGKRAAFAMGRGARRRRKREAPVEANRARMRAVM